jgi:hypothetical protein
MKRFRLSTLMLLIVIAALGVGLIVQHDRASRREAKLQARRRIEAMQQGFREEQAKRELAN